MQKLGGPFIIIAIVAVVISAAIVGGVFMLLSGSGNPAGLTALSADKNVASLESLTLSVPPELVPADFKVGLSSVSAADFEQSKLTDPALTAARLALPGFLKPLSPLFIIKSAGTRPTHLTLALNAAGLRPPETIDVYAWDGTEWKFLPSNRNGERLIANTPNLPQLVGAFQTATTVQVVTTALEVGEAIGPTGSTVNIMQVSGLYLQSDGTLNGGLAGGATPGQGYAIMPLVRTPDDNGATLNAMLADLSAQQKQIGGLVDLANNGDYSGVVLDYRGLDPSRQAAFNQFIIDTAAALHQQSKILALVVPTPKIENANFTTGGYDLKVLGGAADIIELPLGNDLAIVGNGAAEQMIVWATGQVSRFKLRLLTTTLSVDAGSDSLLRVPGQNALSLFGNANLQTDLAAIAPGAAVNVALSGNVQTLDYDLAAFAPRFTYLDESGQTRTVYYVTSETLGHQLTLSQKYNVGGVTVRDLFNSGNPAGMFDSIVQFKLKNAALSTSGATLRYTVNGANGLVYEATAAPGQPFTWTAGDPGQYSIAANFVSGSESGLGSVDVVVPQPTALDPGTPAPSATATLKPFATATPCPGPCPTALPTNTPAPQPSATTKVVTGGGGAWGPFELGGQAVHGGIPNAAEMRRAGMTWVKIQINSTGENAGPAIQTARAQGFKILISFIEFSGAAQATNPDYQQTVANYLAGVAAQGADAIEVWNEANLDRDWPSGQANGGAYVGMLRKAYQAIKAANPNTIVVSGAPAPTGSNGGGCGNFCDDLPWLQQFVAAGGLNYTDCVGIHYNEGIVPPSEIGTDPRDNHYTRYYQTMVNTYAGVIGNARPLCFTELGYLTGEGYPDLASTAPGFAWAAGNTIAEQAQWLAQAASIAKGSSAVRLMIVFNVDYADYGQDPKAGFAIIRADGTCPACDALDAVMP